MQEELLVVDKKDNIIRSEGRNKCHSINGVLHRAFTILIFNKNGNILITKRSKKKKLWPEFWETSCSSHMYKKENYEKTGEKRLLCELRFSCKLRFLLKFQYKATYKNIGSENEVCALLVGQYNNNPKINLKEVAGYRWISIGELKKDIRKNPIKYTIWLKIAFRKYLEYKKSNKGKSPSKILYNEYFNYMKETSQTVDKYIIKAINEYKDIEEIIQSFHGRLIVNNKIIPKLRSTALRLAYEISGGTNWKKIAPACAAIECLDTSHYACDDIFDTVIENKIKVNNLVISSHILYSIATNLLLSIEKHFQRNKVLEALRKMNSLHLAIQKGFFSENFIMGELNFNKNWQRIKNYTFWNPLMEMGAILAGAPKEQTDALKNFGYNIGIAYTLANDACDISNKCEDLMSGKITLLLYFALKNSEGKKLEKIKKCLGRLDCSDKDLKEAVLAIIESGAVEKTRHMAIKYTNKAIEYLTIFPQSRQKDLLIYTTRIVHHNKYYSKINNMVAIV